MSTLFLPGYTADSSAPTADSSAPTADVGTPFYVNLPPLAAADFAARLLRLFPRGWLSDVAQAPGGVAYATFIGISTMLSYLLEGGQFVANGLRIQLAYGTALDVISVDFFGPSGLPRLPGETDNAFRTRILQRLLVPRVTQAAVTAAIEAATGVVPRVCNYYNPAGTGVYDLSSHYSVYGGYEIAPSAYGDSLPYTGFVNITSPISSTTGGYPIYGFDIGAAFDEGVAAYDLAVIRPTTLVEPSFISDVAQTVESYIAMGITVGILFSAVPVKGPIPPIGGFAATTTGASTITQSNDALDYIFQSWHQIYGSWGVWLEVLPWESASYQSQRGIDFTFTFEAPAPSAASIAWLAVSYTSASPLAIRVPVNTGQLSLACSFTMPAGTVPIISPDAAVTPYVTGYTGTTLDITLLPQNTETLETESGQVLDTESGVDITNEFSSGDACNLDIVFLPGTAATVAGSATSLAATAPYDSYALFATPSWATDMSVAKAGASFTLTFETAAPLGSGTVYWAAVAN